MDEETKGTGAEHLKPWLFKKGVSGNPKGRPKGPSLKEWAREYLAGMTDEERLEFMEGIPKTEIWKMTEGNPSNNTDLTSKGEKIAFMPSEIMEKYDITPSAKPDSEG